MMPGMASFRVEMKGTGTLLSSRRTVINLCRPNSWNICIPLHQTCVEGLKTLDRCGLMLVQNRTGKCDYALHFRVVLYMDGWTPRNGRWYCTALLLASATLPRGIERSRFTVRCMQVAVILKNNKALLCGCAVAGLMLPHTGSSCSRLHPNCAPRSKSPSIKPHSPLTTQSHPHACKLGQMRASTQRRPLVRARMVGSARTQSCSTPVY
jgi:hypothetical protein